MEGIDRSWLLASLIDDAQPFGFLMGRHCGGGWGKIYKIMDKSFNREIFINLMNNFLILQIVVSIIWFFIYRLFTRNILKKGKIIFFSNVIIYLFLNSYMIFEIYQESDLRIGGIGFVFEMYTLFLSIFFSFLLLIEYVIFYRIFKYLEQKQS